MSTINSLLLVDHHKSIKHPNSTETRTVCGRFFHSVLLQASVLHHNRISISTSNARREHFAGGRLRGVRARAPLAPNGRLPGTSRSVRSSSTGHSCDRCVSYNNFLKCFESGKYVVRRISILCMWYASKFYKTVQYVYCSVEKQQAASVRTLRGVGATLRRHVHSAHRRTHSAGAQFTRSAPRGFSRMELILQAHTLGQYSNLNLITAYLVHLIKLLILLK